MKKLVSSMILFCMSFLLIDFCLAQAPMQVTTADPLVVAATGGGIAGWIALHGGFSAAILLLVFSAQTAMSALREILYKYDGVEKGQDIPPSMVGLTQVNKICVILGKILDFMQGNVAH